MGRNGWRRALRLGICAVVLLLTGRTPVQGQGLPAGPMAFLHEDTGSRDSTQMIFNLRLLDPRDPAQQTALSAFSTPPTFLGAPVWTRDHRRLAFSANLNILGSLEASSIFAINADGSGLRQVTGFGVLGTLPGPTGTVVGRIEAPAASTGCVISAQGAPHTASCSDDGTFALQGVPAGAAWVRAQADVSYRDPTGATPTGGPGLSYGFAAITVRPGGVADAGTIVLRPQISRSLEPSWSRDGSQLLVTTETTSRSLQANATTGAQEWKSYTGQQLSIYSAAGDYVRTIDLGGNAPINLSGADWSPVDDRIVCSANSIVVGLLNSDGTGAHGIYQVPSDVTSIRQIGQCRWRPDGRQIAFTQNTYASDLSAGLGDLYLLNPDGTGLTQLTRAAANQYVNAPTWSPDGRFLAFSVTFLAADGSQQGSDLYAMGADGSGLTRLTRNGASYFPAW